MRQIQRLASVGFALAVVIAWAGQALGQAAAKPKTAENKAAVAAPKIEIAPEMKDAGIVPKGQLIDTTFVVKNTGGSDLIITDARPGCGCTVASFDKVVKPGAEGKIVTSVDTKNFAGPISKSLLVLSNDPDRPQINLFIKATVKPFVDVLPQPYVRFAVVKGDTDSRDVIIFSEEKSFKPTVAEMAQPYVKAEVSPAGETLNEGDVISEVQGQKISNVADFRAAIDRARSGQTLRIYVISPGRGGNSISGYRFIKVP